MKFTYEAHPARVVFARGARAGLADELRRLGIARAFAIASPRHAGELAPIAAAVHTGAAMHVPVETAHAARAAAADARADGLIAFGGGSPIGLAKAIALDTGLPIVAVPTTFAGSEMTSIWGITEAGEKRTGRDPRVRPRTVIYDPELVIGLPSAGTSGLNALAHAMEAMYAGGVDPITLLQAEEAVRALAASLPGDPDGALYGAWLAGVCLDRAAMGVHHKLCHVLGGSFGLPHAEVHAVILPHAAAYNRDFAPEAMARLSRALGGGDAPTALAALADRLGAPRSLAALGMREGDLDRAADLATRNPYDNPRPIDRASIRALLDDAWRA